MAIQVAMSGGRAFLVDDEDGHLAVGRRWFICNGYPATRTKTGGVRIFIHRVIAGAAPGQVVDHMDGNPMNNKRTNLRICSHAENMQNRRMHKNNKTGAKGVYFDTRRGVYRVEIRAFRKRYCLGSFHVLADAAQAYQEAAAVLHGNFVRQPAQRSGVNVNPSGSSISHDPDGLSLAQI